MAQISIIIGSKTDEAFIKPAREILEQFGINYELAVISAHRNPERLRKFVAEAGAKGIEVMIAAAGAAAHLPGVIASLNDNAIPVIGVPLPTSELKGVDSLYSIVQMPSGIPVACMGIGNSGAKNAALFAAQILGIKYPEIREKCINYRRNLEQG
ncbi:MAG TPA: 5-(carboxyamino)imidazole ribonucleotide mutase [Dehalococcoidia bacterium]|nr:5-(carboxyamino)imidazole ribonucleotide mutase [Dehalococcoidia bacterium]